ncbi:unnamed protein product [Albugo candida]|uniref:Uncharacterized protein n=2 Tax=Albugo candida TaxID=65357 RepID=A0A024G2N5_9STRA|nr:unnamed protein product [Albugo candida]|eukprot:CCI40578.1 unnamed protein product [Albugo candida]
MVAPSGLLTPKRVIMGSTDAVAYVQQMAEEVMKPVLGKGISTDSTPIYSLASVATESVLTRNYVCQQQDSGILIECIRGTSGCYGWVHPTKRGLNVLLLA